MDVQELFYLFTAFLLAIFIGVELIAKVPSTLHTPLMSGTNAISAITIVGALIQIPNADPTWANILGFLALILAIVNVIGGFLITDRILKMFKNRN